MCESDMNGNPYIFVKGNIGLEAKLNRTVLDNGLLDPRVAVVMAMMSEHSSLYQANSEWVGNVIIPDKKPFRDGVISYLTEKPSKNTSILTNALITMDPKIDMGIGIIVEGYNVITLDGKIGDDDDTQINLYSYGNELKTFFKEAVGKKTVNIPHHWKHQTEHMVDNVIEWLLNDINSEEQSEKKFPYSFKKVDQKRSKIPSYSLPANLKESIEFGRKFHGHVCPGLTYGLVASYLAMEKVMEEGGTYHTVVVQSPGDSCMTDGVLVTLAKRDEDKTILDFYSDQEYNTGRERVGLPSLINKRGSLEDPRFVMIGNSDLGGYISEIKEDVLKNVFNKLNTHKSYLTGSEFVKRAESVAEGMGYDVATVRKIDSKEFKHIINDI